MEKSNWFSCIECVLLICRDWEFAISAVKSIEREEKKKKPSPNTTKFIRNPKKKAATSMQLCFCCSIIQIVLAPQMYESNWQPNKYLTDNNIGCHYPVFFSCVCVCAAHRRHTEWKTKIGIEKLNRREMVQLIVVVCSNVNTSANVWFHWLHCFWRWILLFVKVEQSLCVCVCVCAREKQNPKHRPLTVCNRKPIKFVVSYLVSVLLCNIKRTGH